MFVDTPRFVSDYGTNASDVLALLVVVSNNTKKSNFVTI